MRFPWAEPPCFIPVPAEGQRGPGVVPLSQGGRVFAKVNV